MDQETRSEMWNLREYVDKENRSAASAIFWVAICAFVFFVIFFIVDMVNKERIEKNKDEIASLKEMVVGLELNKVDLPKTGSNSPNEEIQNLAGALGACQEMSSRQRDYVAKLLNRIQELEGAR